MYLGRKVNVFCAEDDATLVVPRTQVETPPQEVVAEVSPAQRTVVIERIIEKPVIVEKRVEVEKIVPMPVPVTVAPESNFFEDHVPQDWVQETAVSDAVPTAS